MNRFFKLIKNNKLYTVLLLFVILVNVFVFAGWMSSKNTEVSLTGAETKTEEKSTLFDEDEIKNRQEKIKTLYHEDPLLYGFIAFLNLFIIFIIFLGMLVDAGIVNRRIQKKTIKIPGLVYEKPRWNIVDVFRVALIFLSFGYAFIIIEGFIYKIFPVSNNRNMEMVLNTALINIVGIWVVCYFVKKKYGQSLSTVGITAKNIFPNICYAIYGYVALLPVLATIMLVTFFVIKWIGYSPPVQPVVEILMKEKETSVLWVSIIFAGVFGPVAEEIFFRGFMYGAIKKKFGVLWAIMITAIIFSVLHAHLVGIIPIFVLGMFLAYIFEKTGSLVAPITVHIAHNIGMVVLAFTARSLGT